MKIARPLPVGFTMIELLVVVVISLLLIGGGLAAFSNFSDKRSVITAVEELKQQFQSAQAKAASGDLGGCDQLSGYRLQTYQSGNHPEVSLQAECGAGTADTAQISELADGVTIDPNLNVLFQVLNGGVQLPAGVSSLDITVSNPTNSYFLTLFREGRVSEGSWQ
jgi:prepilin-type N-terminal cleavage/methylation domain-containing protein